MAQTIKLKRSATPGGVPTTSALALGEVAINTADGKMYIKKDVGGTESIVEIGSGGGGSLDVIWKQYVYTAGVSQTVFTGADDNSDILAYAVNFIEVYLNGILLDPSVDFTATDNTSIVFTEAPATGDLIQIDTFAKSVGIGDILLNSFTGDNSTTIFTLSDAPGDENNTSVFIGGVYQNKTTYSVSGTSLTFSEAPATNAEIEVVIGSRNVSLTDIADLSISGVLTASGGNSTNWNTAYGWGDHSTAGYLPLTGGTLSGSLSLGFNDITSVGTITATQFSGELFGNVTGNVLGNVTGDVTGSAGTVTSLAGHTTTELTEGTNLYYTDARADARVALIVDSAPVTLDTLNELAAALGDDPNFATTTATTIGLKAPLDSPTFTGPVVFNSTGSIKVPVGTTAERDVIPTSGMFRYNSSEAQFEGYQDGSWGAIGGGGGGSNTFTTDSFIGDGSTTDYVLSQTISSEDNLLVFIEGVFQQQDAYSIATVAGVTTLTFTVAPIDTRDIIIYSVAGAVSGSNLNIDTMIGDNTTTDLILSIAPINENNTQVFLDGVYQNKSTYSISGTTLTFSTAPPTDTEVEVMTFTQTDINVPVDNTITTAKLVDGSVTSAKLDTNIAVASLVATTADINAGTIDGTTIGATTPASVAATTLSTTGAATFSGTVTADDAGFYQLAGTSQLRVGASSSYNWNISRDNISTGGLQIQSKDAAADVTRAFFALNGDISFYEDTGTTPKFFWDASAESLGIGTSSPSRLAHLYGTSNPALRLDNGTNSVDIGIATSSGALLNGSTTNDLVIARNGAYNIKFGTNGNTRATIDASGNVGIGTNSPASGLELEGVGNATNITLDNITASTGRSYSIRSGNTGNLDFYDNDVTSARMAINASGVLGVGVVPYTQWRTDYKALQIGVSGALWSSINNNNTLLSNNTAANANGSRYRLVAGAAAELYLTGTGTFDFRSSPTSGAVSSIISDMTTKMTLDSAGNLLLASSANWNSVGTIGSLITGPHYTRLPTANGLYWLSSVNTSNQYIVQNNASNGVYIAYGATSWSSTSDERLKDIIEPITDGLEKVATLRTVIGKYKTDEEEVRRPFLMAQDVFEVLPEAVDQSNPDAWGLSTHDLTPLLVSALKDAKNLIEALTARIEALEGA